MVFHSAQASSDDPRPLYRAGGHELDAVLVEAFFVTFAWAWNYFTRNRAARLITGAESSAKET